MCSSWPRLRSSRCINSRGRSNPSELPLFFISIFIANPSLMEVQTTKATLYKCITRPAASFNNCFTASPHRLQLINHPRDHRQPAVPEFRILGVEPERFQQFGIVLGAAGGEHVEIAPGEALGGVLVDRIERVHQAIAERIGIDVERRVDEGRDVHPEMLVARADVGCRAQAPALPTDPTLADAP